MDMDMPLLYVHRGTCKEQDELQNYTVLRASCQKAVSEC